MLQAADKEVSIKLYRPKAGLQLTENRNCLVGIMKRKRKGMGVNGANVNMLRNSVICLFSLGNGNVNMARNHNHFVFHSLNSATT